MHCHLRPKRILLLGRTVLVAEPRKHFLQSLAMLLKHDGFEKKQIELLGMLSTFPDYFQPLVVAAFSKTWNCLHKTYWSFLIRNLSLFVYHLKINQKYCYPFQILHKRNSPENQQRSRVIWNWYLILIGFLLTVVLVFLRTQSCLRNHHLLHPGIPWLFLEEKVIDNNPHQLLSMS